MDILKWQGVIIEWINCLKLSKPISSVQDLKDEEFFKELHIILSKKDKRNSSDNITYISDFLKRHYPAFSLENESAHIQDSIEITYAYSLLLHYCSLVDCSDEFILPLCKDLCYMSQIFVKHFLEDLQLSTVITRDILKNAIYKIHKYAATPTKPFNRSFSSPKTPCSTPLLEYLKTPYKNVNYELHKKEMKQLQAQLDLERFEKSDLQEELNLQYEKNKKLDKNISEKQSEISRLRSELLSLENRTPPANNKRDGQFENKRLRDEVVSLEKYVVILHKEQEDLQTERDKARDKLRRMEEQCTDWQNKSIISEKQVNKLTEENKNYLQELFYLRERCEELSTMLQELHPKKTCDESFEADLFLYDSPYNKSGSVDSATLAQTVVDVQLVDAQAENKTLRDHLSELEKNTSELKRQLSQMEIEVTKLEDENKSLQQMNNELNEKVLILNDTQQELETTKIELQKTSKSLLETTKDNGNLNSTLNELNLKLLDIESSLNVTLKENEDLIDKLKVTTETNNACIDQFNLEIKNLILEKENIHEKLLETEQKATNYESNNDMLKSHLETFCYDIEECLIKFKNQLNYTDDFPNDCDTLCKLVILIDAFVIKDTNDSETVSNLQTSCHTLSSQISKLEEEISTLNLNEVKTKHEIDNLKVCLKTAENKIEHYEKEVVSNYENLIDKYKSIIEEKCGMISELTKLKDVLIHKENAITRLQKEKDELSNKSEMLDKALAMEKRNTQTLENNCSQMKNVIQEKDSFIKALEMEKLNLQENIDLLNQQLLVELNNLKELKILVSKNEHLIQTLENEKASMTKEIDDLINEAIQVNTYQKELEIKCEYLNNIIIEKDAFIDELNIRNNDSITKIVTLKEEIIVLQNLQEVLTLNSTKKIEEKIVQINDFEAEVSNLNTQLVKVENELSESLSVKSKYETLYNQTKLSLNEKISYIKDLNNEKHELESHIDGLSNQVKSLEEDLSQEKSLKEELNNDLKAVKKELACEKSKKDEINDQFIRSKQNYESESKNLCNEIEEKRLEIESLQKQIGSLNENIETINTEVLNISSMLSLEMGDVQSKERTIENLNSHLINLKEQLSLTLEEKKETLEEVKVCKQKILYYKEQFETYKCEMENAFEDINVNLTEKIECEKFSACNNDDVSILETLRKALHKEQDKGKEVLFGDMLQKLVKLKQNIYNLAFENHRVNSEINAIQKQYNILDGLKTDIEMKLDSVSEESNNKITDLNEQLAQLQTENEMYVSKLEMYRGKLNVAHESLAETQISVEGLIKKHKMEIENYKESIVELKHKNGRLEGQVRQLKTAEKQLTDDMFSYQNKLKNVLQEYDSTVQLNEDTKHKRETEINVLSNRLVKQTESLEQLQESLSKTNLELEGSLREIEMYRSLKKEFETSFSALNQEHQETVTEYEANMKQLKLQNDVLREEIDNLLKENTTAKDKLNMQETKQAELHTRIKHFTHETEKLEEKLLLLTNKLESVERERLTLSNSHEELVKSTDLMMHETKRNHQQAIEKLQFEMDKLNLELGESQTLISTLEMKREEFEEDLVTKVSSIDKLREGNLQLQKTIDVLNDDKHVLILQLDQLNDDLIKMKSCNNAKYEEKLEEINDTKTKLSYALHLIENISELFESEFEKSSVELTDSQESLKQCSESDSENQCARVQNEIINLKKRIEIILDKKHQLELELENVASKTSNLEERCSQEKLNYELTYQKIVSQNNEQLNTLKAQNKEIIENLEERLRNEKKTSHIYLREIQNLNSKLIEDINEIEKVTNDKSMLIQACKNVASELSILKKKRNELVDVQNTVIKEVESYVLRTHETVEHIKNDYIHRVEQLDKERSKDKNLLKQLENFLGIEKNTVSFLENRINDLTTEKNQLVGISSTSFTNIHDLYINLFEDNLDSDITQQINKLKQNQSELEDKLQSLNFEQEIVDKEIELITNEFVDLKRIRGEISNYELVKSDYATLKNKYNLMSVCETENNGYKMKISDLENKLSDLQHENVKYQKEIAELQSEYSNLNDEHAKEIHLMQSSNLNWKKIAEDKVAEIEKISGSLQGLTDKNQLNEEMIFQEKCKNEELINSNNKLETELDQQIQMNAKLISDGKTDYDLMNQKYDLISQKLATLENENLNLQEKVAKYKNIITELERDNLNLNKNHSELKQRNKVLIEQCNHDANKVDREEVDQLRTCYTNLMGENSRLQLDCTVLKKTIEERNNQLSKLSFIKESYEKLLEDNNKSHMELDTLRYKRNRDKEEFKRLLEEERTKGTTNADSQITEIRNEYEEKLKKMKEKMVNLYKEEMEKEKKKFTLKFSQSDEIIQSMKSQLWVAGNKNVDLSKEIERLQEKLRSVKENIHMDLVREDLRGSRESVNSLKERRTAYDVDERRISTLPRETRSVARPQVNIIEETVTVSRKRRSITGGVTNNLDQGLKMEDEEGELFNNTYLSDLKAGRCIESGRESVSSRISELQYRNSMCPPHLKSSYPAETQFSSPRQFKEEDLKMGTVDLDDSMSSSLLPGEKPRMKKDWGQTMYKKPGPPTPSKNGGRLSLQGSEVHPRDVLREHNENKAQGSRTVSTPSRIKMLFSRNSISHRNDSENISTPPKGRRRSIFRR